MLLHSSTNVSFTFDPKLSIALSTDNLTIGDIVPGAIKDSNSITVAVSSNTPYGYTLSANVGSNDSTSTYYNTSSLIHEDSTINNTFTSIATNASEETLTTDNTWGYSTSIDNGNTWSTYSGLSNTNKTLLDTNNPASSSTIDFKVAAKSSTTQASGTHNNIITFYAVGKPKPPQYLYDEVAKMSKGMQTNAEIRAKPTNANSGVYEYNSAVFGESSDAANTHKIYYYRGILDSSYSSFSKSGIGIGSSGDGELYPNYVILSATKSKTITDTCWRIVRTTGSGGVKMIYNGLWTGATCANAINAAQIGTSAFNGTSGSDKQIVRVGYTYDSSYAENYSIGRYLSTLFGTNNSDNNSDNSTIKTNIDNLSTFTNILEPSAGYCGDRMVYDASNVPQPETLVIPQYSTNTTTNYFGNFSIGWYTSRSPSLACSTDSNADSGYIDRSKVDLYSVNGAPTGNGRLTNPIALLTVSETVFAGLGSNLLTYLMSYSDYWLLSPAYRYSNGYAAVFFIKSADGRNLNIPSSSYGVRPSISLNPNIEYTSGSGTAADPWVVMAP